MKRLLLFSAGKESIYSLFTFKPHALLLFNYGQLAFKKERDSANYYGESLGIQVSVLDVPAALLHLPPGIRSGLGNSHVAARNLIFLSLALNYAVTYGYGQVAFGGTDGEVYTDGDRNFGNHMNLITRSLYGVEIVTPTGSLKPHEVGPEIVRRKFDLAGFWSCDGDGTSPHANAWGHCGVCDKCRSYLIEWACTKKPSKAQLQFYRKFYSGF